MDIMDISDAMHPVKLLGIECTSAYASSVLTAVFAYFGYIYNAVKGSNAVLGL